MTQEELDYIRRQAALVALEARDAISYEAMLRRIELTMAETVRNIQSKTIPAR